MARTMVRRPSLVAALALALVLPAAAARAQGTLAIRTGTDLTSTSYTFTGSSCSSTLALQWVYTPLTTVTFTGNLQLWATAGSCGTAPGSDDLRFTDVPYYTMLTALSGTFSVPIASLPGFNGVATDGGTAPVACGDQGITKTHQVCGAVPYVITYSSTQTLQATALSLVYDSQPPTAPTLGTAFGEDGVIKVPFTASSDSTYVDAELASPDAGFVGAGQVTASVGTISITGLVNGTLYRVRLRAEDGAGNLSDYSPVVEVAPVPTCGFLCVLQDAGINDVGVGCGAAPAAPAGPPWSLALSALLPLLALALRRALAPHRP